MKMYFSLGAIFQYYYYFIPLKNFFQFCLSGLPGVALCCFFSFFFLFVKLFTFWNQEKFKILLGPR